MQTPSPTCTVHAAYLLCCEVRGLILGRHKAGKLGSEFHTFFISAKLSEEELVKALTSNTPPPAITRSDLPYTVALATTIIGGSLFFENSDDTRRIWAKAAAWLWENE
jgi:hypothetical protein